MNKRLMKALAFYYLLLWGLYVGSYFVLVDPVQIDVRLLGGEAYVYEHYDLDDERMAMVLFQPIHAIDRNLRPHVWRCEGETGPGKMAQVRVRKRAAW